MIIARCDYLPSYYLTLRGDIEIIFHAIGQSGQKKLQYLSISVMTFAEPKAFINKTKKITYRIRSKGKKYDRILR